MKNNKITDIDYHFFIRSALRFTYDLEAMPEILDNLSKEQVNAVTKHVENIKQRLQHLGDKLSAGVFG